MSPTRILSARTAAAGVAVTLLTGAIACGHAHAASPAVGKAPVSQGSVELTWAPTYMSDDSNYSSTEALSMAKRFNLIAGTPSAFSSYALQMKAANPKLSLLTYANATFLPASRVASTPASEFAHDVHGNKIRSKAFGTYLMEPSSAAWRANATADCKTKAAAAHYDGCLVDMLTMGIYSKGFVTALPAKPGTHTEYTQTQWRSLLEALAKQYTTDDPTDITIGNSVSNAFRYWDSPVTSRPIVMDLPGAQMEDFLRGAADSASSFPSVATWQDSVRVISDIESSGHTGLFSTKLWSKASRAQVAQWQGYAMASFLMAANGHSYFAFTDARTKVGAMETDLPYSMPKTLGTPSKAMAASGSLFIRTFSHGKVIVNPGSSAATVSLGGTFTNLAGKTVSSVTMPAHSGDVFVTK
jgi:hypothetical protein